MSGQKTTSKGPVTWSLVRPLTSFRWKLVSGLGILIGILSFFPVFFKTIQDRNGRQLTDIFLQWLPPHNFSLLVFILIWACCVLLVVRVYRDPLMLLNMLWAYNLVTLVRMACIALISLNPPAGLIPLADPITNMFYGKDYITHDLFFSGHTTTVFLIFLCMKKKMDRMLVLIASMVVGVLLLVQHVHYTIDVLAAPVFTYVIYRLTGLFTESENRSTTSGMQPI